MSDDGSIAGRVRARGVPLRYVIPNLMTTISLCCGMASLHFSIKQDWDRALQAIALAAVFDLLDGRFARILRTTSRFGAVLDSLADFLSFGVAPAILLYLWMLNGVDVLGLGAVMTFALCSALRLARYTSMVPTKAGAEAPTDPVRLVSREYFVGMPTPAAAGAVCVPVMLDVSKSFEWKWPAWTVVALTLGVALLMVSRRPMFSLKRVRVRRGLVVPLLVVVGFMVVLTVKDPWLTCTAIAGGYLASLPVSMVTHHRAVTRAAGGRVRGAWAAAPPLREQIREAERRERADAS